VKLVEKGGITSHGFDEDNGREGREGWFGVEGGQWMDRCMMAGEEKRAGQAEWNNQPWF